MYRTTRRLKIASPAYRNSSTLNLLLPVVNVCPVHRLTCHVGALESLGQRLSVLGNNVATRLVIFPVTPFHFPSRRIRIYLFTRNGVKSRPGCRVVLAIVLIGETGIGSIPLRRFLHPGYLQATFGRRLAHVRSALKCR